MDRGQIWIETVMYTLIALIMMGAVLAFAKPKIDEIQDKLVIDRTFEAMQEIDAQIQVVMQGSVGNKRVVNVEVKDGTMEINGPNNEITYVIEESKSMYSEPDKDVNVDGIIVNTQQVGNSYTITLTLDYADDYGTKYIIENEDLILTKSPTAYKLSITNNGNVVIEEI
jgi:hypothetical protein